MVAPSGHHWCLKFAIQGCLNPFGLREDPHQRPKCRSQDHHSQCCQKCYKLGTETASDATTHTPHVATFSPSWKRRALVVWHLDRLGRVTPRPPQTTKGLGTGSIGFKSQTEVNVTPTSGGKLIFCTFAALAEHSRRTQVCLIAKITSMKLAQTQRMRENGLYLTTDIIDVIRFGRTPLYRDLKQ